MAGSWAPSVIRRIRKELPNSINPHPILRKHYDLFANIRPSRSLPGVPAVHSDVDLIIVRENNEGFPPDRNVFMGNGEFRPSPDMTIGIRVITRQGSSKVARAAFELARHAAAQEAHVGAQGHRLQARLRDVCRGMPQTCEGVSRGQL